jgi:flagellar biosynthesis protein FliR
MIGLLNDGLIILILVFCRLGGCLLIMPGVSSARVPTQSRVLLAVALSISLAPLVSSDFAAVKADDNAELLRMIFLETLIGLFAGLAVRVFMLALGFGAAAIATSIGFQGLQGPGIDEAEPQAALVTLITMAALTLMFILDFHHDVIRGLVSSYRVMPVGVTPDAERLLGNLVDVLTDSFLIVLRLASPFLVYALIVNFMLGLLNKLTPQIPVYFVSLPFVLTGGLMLLYFAIPVLLSQFAEGHADLRIFK